MNISEFTLPDILFMLENDEDIWVELGPDYQQYLATYSDLSKSGGGDQYIGRMGKAVFSDYDPHNNLAVRFYKVTYEGDRMSFTPEKTITINNIKALSDVTVQDKETTNRYS